MFDKAKYWERRQKNLRGQVTAVLQKRTPKGETVSYITREDQRAEYPNAGGSYMFGGNRKQTRRRVIDRDPTKPNYEYRTTRDTSPFKGHQRNLDKNPSIELPMHPPAQTNRHRLLENRAARRFASTKRTS